jgi:hypothetical protein
MNDTTFCEAIRSEEVSALRKRKQEIERECEYLNETATDAFESSGWERSVTLTCGCEVRIKRVDDGMESWWTEREWTMCDKHEGLDP